MNCHPAGDHPLQGADHREHSPPVWRGESGAGVPGASCAMCHTESNFTLHEAASYQSIPGNPRWQLAPLSMSWEGKTLGDICRQLKDKDRNGGRDLAALQEHVAKDDLVTWGWNPGPGRGRHRAIRKRPGRWFKPGSIAERIVRDQSWAAQIETSVIDQDSRSCAGSRYRGRSIFTRVLPFCRTANSSSNTCIFEKSFISIFLSRSRSICFIPRVAASS